MSRVSKQEVYKTLGTSRQALGQYFKRRAAYQSCVASVEWKLLLLRSDHGGIGLEKAYFKIAPKCLGRDAFIREMTRRGHALVRKSSYMRTTRSNGFRYPNLIKGLTIKGLNRVWQSDTTYYWVSGRFYYLTFILDLYSRLITGYYVGDHLRAEANISALKMAFRTRRGMSLNELIFHSDGATQYRAHNFTELLRKKYISSSMCCSALNNAYAEKINDVIKNEYLRYWSIDSFTELRKAVKRAVSNYNTKRPHGQLPDRLAPADFEYYLYSDTNQDHPGLYIKDGQSWEWEHNPVAVQNLPYPSSVAGAGIKQILPAFVQLDVPKKDQQLSLKLV